jgi:hypothetical protein
MHQGGSGPCHHNGGGFFTLNQPSIVSVCCSNH